MSQHAEETDDRMTYFGTISLGGLIELLEKRGADQDVRYDFGWFTPKKIDSYRGYYDHLALDYADSHDAIEAIKVGELLAILREADGKTYEGYKGGDFQMHLDTPVWVAKWGEGAGTAIVGIYEGCDYEVILETRHVGG